MTKSNNLQLIHGRFEHIYKQLLGNKIDLCFLDPPDNEGRAYDHYDDKLSDYEYTCLLDSWISKACELTDGPVFISFAEKWIPAVEHTISESHIPLVQRIWWKYGFGQAHTKKYASCVRPIYWLNDPTIYPDNIRIPSQRQLKYKDKRANSKGKLPENIWNFNRVCGTFGEKRKWHPTQHPESLMTRIINGHSKEGDIVLDGFIGCYDEKTEILTNDGWKFFKDIKHTDSFASLNSKNTISYKRASKIHKYKYNGNMIKIKCRSVDLLVTPNHNMYVKTHADHCAGRSARFIEAQNMNQNIYKIPCEGSYAGRTSISFGKDSETDKSNTMFLLGLYISEGYVEKDKTRPGLSNIIICQNPGIKYDKMWARLGQSFHINKQGHRKIRVKLTKKQIEFIKKHCGNSVYNKTISKKLLHSKFLRSLWNGMMLGDGHKSKSGQSIYYTSSKRLSSDCQILLRHLGFNSSISIREPRKATIRGKLINSTIPQYQVFLHKSENRHIEKKHIQKTKYDGVVYCVTVPDHIVFVRRNQNVSWCGNSGTTAYVCQELNRKCVGVDNSSYYLKKIEREYLKRQGV